MHAIAIENFRLVAGGADADVKMQSEGMSVFCPDNVCPTVQVGGQYCQTVAPVSDALALATFAGAVGGALGGVTAALVAGDVAAMTLADIAAAGALGGIVAGGTVLIGAAIVVGVYYTYKYNNGIPMCES